MSELKTLSKNIVNQKETFYNCFELNDGRIIILLEKHAVVYDHDFTALSIWVFDKSTVLLTSGKMTEESSNFKPICSYQDEFGEDGTNDIIIGFRLTKDSIDLTDSTITDPFDSNKPLKVFYKGKHPFDSIVAHAYFDRQTYEKINFLKPPTSGMVANELVTGLLRCSLDTLVMSTYHN